MVTPNPRPQVVNITEAKSFSMADAFALARWVLKAGILETVLKSMLFCRSPSARSDYPSSAPDEIAFVRYCVGRHHTAFFFLPDTPDRLSLRCCAAGWW